MIAKMSPSIKIADISGQRAFQTDSADEITPQHTVGQAVDFYLDRMRIHRNGLPFIAFARGVRLDSKTQLQDLPEVDNEWTVVPEVSAG